MKKIVIFCVDSGGEIFANALREELPFAEITEVWSIKSFEGKLTRHNVRNEIEEAVYEYIGKVDVVVIASYLASEMALEYLQMKYPQQKFVGFLPQLAKQVKIKKKEDNLQGELMDYKKQLGIKQRINFALQGYTAFYYTDVLQKIFEKDQREAIVVMIPKELRKTRIYFEDKKILQKCQVVEPEYSYIDFRENLCRIAREFNVKAVLIYETAFFGKIDVFKKIYGENVKIYDGINVGVINVMRKLGMKVI